MVNMYPDSAQCHPRQDSDALEAGKNPPNPKELRLSDVA
jgi:hypothetical protein